MSGRVTARSDNGVDTTNEPLMHRNAYHRSRSVGAESNTAVDDINGSRTHENSYYRSRSVDAKAGEGVDSAGRTILELEAVQNMHHMRLLDAIDQLRELGVEKKIRLATDRRLRDSIMW